MPDHLIQLRRAWEGPGPLDPGAEPWPRIDLPTAWAAPPSAPFRLRRAFNRPPFDPARERLALRLGSVPGLRSILLNQRELWGRGAMVQHPSILHPIAKEPPPDLPVDPDWLDRRNLLTLEVDPADWPGPSGPWGEIALVIALQPTPAG